MAEKKLPEKKLPEKKSAEKKSAEKEVGKVAHYYEGIGVAVVKVSAAIKKGDKLHFKGHTTDFTQAADSMQVEHKALAEAKKGQSIGMKVADKVREGDTVFKA